MSLRARMGLASGVAVALAVIAVAVSAYAGTRAELNGQLDQALKSLAARVLPPPATNGAGSAPGGFGAAAGGFGAAAGGFGAAAGGSGAAAGGSGAAAGGSGGAGVRPAAGAGLSGGAPVVGTGFGARTRAIGPEGIGHGDEGLGFDLRRGQPFGGAAGIVTLVYRDGGTYVPSGQKYRIPTDAQARAIAASGRGHYYTDLEVRNTHIRVLATGLGTLGALLVALPRTDVDSALASQLLLLILIAAGGIALAALLGILVARTALAPIARFTRQTESVAARPDRLDRERLDVRGGDELARLAQTFNRTLDALQSSVAAQRNLVADASHELRTPIATIRANLQLMRDEQLLSPADREALRTDVIEELDELTALVGDVVELARGTKPDGEPGDVRLDAIVSAAADRTRRRAPQLTVQANLEPTLVHGEGDRIARAVANLLDNATKWSPPEAVIEIALQDGTLTVRDHGPGFHEEDLPFVFDRFHRARDARSKPGSGLGLAIVRQAAEAHGGFVVAENAAGGGALMRIGFGPTQEIAESVVADTVGSS